MYEINLGFTFALLIPIGNNTLKDFTLFSFLPRKEDQIMQYKAKVIIFFRLFNNHAFLFTDMTKLVSTRQQLDAQLNENKVVQEVKPA